MELLYVRWLSEWEKERETDKTRVPWMQSKAFFSSLLAARPSSSSSFENVNKFHGISNKSPCLPLWWLFMLNRIAFYIEMFLRCVHENRKRFSLIRIASVWEYDYFGGKKRRWEKNSNGNQTEQNATESTLNPDFCATDFTFSTLNGF